MSFALVLAATVVAVVVLRNALKRHSRAFYVGAIALEVLYGLGTLTELPDVLRQPLYLLMQQATLAMALFVIVMFVGVFPPESRPARLLRPVRTELSVLACLLVLGHMAVYLLCIPRLFTGGLVTTGVLVGFVVAVALSVLLAVLGPTSAERAKRALGARRWKRVQRWAYLFYALTYMHLMLVLAPSIEHGVTAAATTAAVYTVVFAVYAVARIGRAIASSGAFSFAMGHSKALGSETDEGAHNAVIG